MMKTRIFINSHAARATASSRSITVSGRGDRRGALRSAAGRRHVSHLPPAECCSRAKHLHGEMICQLAEQLTIKGRQRGVLVRQLLLISEQPGAGAPDRWRHPGRHEDRLRLDRRRLHSRATSTPRSPSPVYAPVIINVVRSQWAISPSGHRRGENIAQRARRRGYLLAARGRLATSWPSTPASQWAAERAPATAAPHAHRGGRLPRRATPPSDDRAGTPADDWRRFRWATP